MSSPSDNDSSTNFHWSRCASGCVHLFLGAVTLNFTPQQLALLARTVAEIQQELKLVFLDSPEVTVREKTHLLM
jgi:hypothetical protein